MVLELHAMPNRRSLKQFRMVAIAVVATLAYVSLLVHAQNEQDETSDPDFVESEEGSSIEEDENLPTPVAVDDEPSEDSQAVSEDLNSSEETTSDEEAEDSESLETPDFFDPSEEISEDYGVDFPVDI